MKRIIRRMMVFCTVFTTIVCISSIGITNGNEKEAILFSNLVNEESLQQIDEILTEAGVSKEHRDTLFFHVNQFNQAVDTSNLVSNFSKGDPSTSKYDPYDFQNQWTSVHADFEGYNCRITAFSLFSEFVHVNEISVIRDNYLFLDSLSLDVDPSALIDTDKDTFLCLFSSVPTENTTDITIHAANVIQDWKERGIEFVENSMLSLITVWFHNQWSTDENELFIGHAGVLVRVGKRMCFIEKIAFQEPYQATWFNNISELCDYLMRKYDVSWGQDTASPFVMENNHLLQH